MNQAHGRRAALGRWRWPLVASVAVAAAAMIAAALWQRPSAPIPAAATAAAAFRQIVVLPFANVTKDPADQVFADGLVETLTSSLTSIERFQRSLRVVPASEVRVARIDSAKEARQAFGATLAITGSIQRLASSMRLTLNLVDTVQLVQLGSRTIDFTIGQEAMTQDSVVGAVMTLLSLELERPKPRPAPVTSATLPSSNRSAILKSSLNCRVGLKTKKVAWGWSLDESQATGL